MMNWWVIQQLSEIRQKEILKDVERCRQLRPYETNKKKPKLRFHALLGNLGKLLVCCGSFLEERYGVSSGETF
jgi:hypothetical protein